MAVASLYGWAIKISWLGADHTYVTSSDGGVWPCWGRSSGGRKIAAGTGSSRQANCISQTSSHAGIIYGVTGVCHQTSNRILYPSRKLVSRARGYWASLILYGTYGTNGLAPLLEWEARKARCAKVAGTLGAKKKPLTPKLAAMSARPAAAEEVGLQSYVEKVVGMYEQQTRSITLAAVPKAERIDLLARELELMADFRLGAERDSKKIRSLQRLQADLLKEKDDLDQGLIGKDLTAEDYARKVNRLVSDLLKRGAAELGKESYTRLFGVAPDVVFQLVDPRILARHHK